MHMSPSQRIGADGNEVKRKLLLSYSFDVDQLWPLWQPTREATIPDLPYMSL